MAAGEPSCRELTELLSDYLAADLPAGQRARFERHLRGCEACALYLGAFEQAVRLGKAACAAPDGALPDDVPEELVQAILAARRAEQ